MVVEVALATSGLIEGGNVLRAATGFLFGFFALVGGLQALARLGPRISTPESSGINRS
jgi:hypothetical protein